MPQSQVFRAKAHFNIFYCASGLLILRPGLFKNNKSTCARHTFVLKESLYNAYFTILLLLLLLQSGDIEINPGPSTLNHGSLSILHSNIRSTRNKLDFVKDFFFDFNILYFTETHLDPNVPAHISDHSATFFNIAFPI